MKSISEITNENIVSQVNEYHLMVSEILTGMDAGITSLRRENSELRAKLDEISAQIAGFKKEQGTSANLMLIIQKEVATLMAKHDALKEFTEQGFTQLFRLKND